VAVFLAVALAILASPLPGRQGSAPQKAAAEFARAVALFNEHDDTGEALAEAEHAFALVLAREPRHAAARAYEGLIALERGDQGAAETAFRDALAVDGRCAEAHVGRVRLLRAEGKWEASYEEARAAVRLAPASVLARWELVDILLHRAEAPVGERERNEAAPHLLRIIALQKAPRQAHLELADIYREQQQWRAAIPHYQAVLRIGQTADDSDVWVYEVNRTVAECYERLGDAARAVAYLERYLRELRTAGAPPETISDVERKIAQLRRSRAPAPGASEAVTQPHASSVSS
jgi:tetratricopeptide (TPR) repeat protein